MIDSSGRPFSSGQMEGSVTDLGSFDECLAIDVDHAAGNGGFVGQYCIAKYALPLPQPRPPGLTLQSNVFNFSGTSVEGTVRFTHLVLERRNNTFFF